MPNGVTPPNPVLQPTRCASLRARPNTTVSLRLPPLVGSLRTLEAHGQRCPLGQQHQPRGVCRAIGEKRAAMEVILLSVLISRTGSPPVRPLDALPESEVVSDTFCSGCAYLGENANEAIEPAEPLPGGMIFTVTLDRKSVV